MEDCQISPRDEIHGRRSTCPPTMNSPFTHCCTRWSLTLLYNPEHLRTDGEGGHVIKSEVVQYVQERAKKCSILHGVRIGSSRVIGKNFKMKFWRGSERERPLALSNNECDFPHFCCNQFLRLQRELDRKRQRKWKSKRQGEGENNASARPVCASLTENYTQCQHKKYNSSTYDFRMGNNSMPLLPASSSVRS